MSYAQFHYKEGGGVRERNFFLHAITISIFLREINFLEVIFNGTFPIPYAFEVEKFHMYNYSSRTSW
jgi:hypothetical protein